MQNPNDTSCWHINILPYKPRNEQLQEEFTTISKEILLDYIDVPNLQTPVLLL